MRSALKAIWGGLVMGAMLGASASGQSINIDFEVSGGFGAGAPSGTFAGAAGYSSALVANNHWNAITEGVTSVPLRDVSGVLTGVTLSYAGTSTPFFGTEATQLTGDFERLIADWVVTPVVSFEGLLPGAYSLYTYAGSGGGMVIHTNPASAAPTEQIASYINVPFNGFFSGFDLGGSVSTHTSHELLVGTDGRLTILPGGPVSYRFAGIQLVRRGGAPGQLSGSISTPALDSCVSGPVTVFGSATGPGNLTYTVEYGTSLNGPFTAFGTGSGPIVNGLLGSWNTQSLSPGLYYLRLTVIAMGYGATSSLSSCRVGNGDSTPPVASISSPAGNAWLCGTVPVIGTAADAGISGWTLDYAGPLGNGWVPIASGTTNVEAGGTLASWNTSGLARGAYVLRLRVTDSGSANCSVPVGQTREAMRTVIVGLRSDATADGLVNTVDLTWLLAQFGQSCQ